MAPDFEDFIAGCVPALSVGAHALGEPVTGSGAVICLIAVEPDDLLSNLFAWRDQATDDEFTAKWSVSSRWAGAEHDGLLYARLTVQVTSPLPDSSFSVLLRVSTAAAGLKVAANGDPVFLARQDTIDRADEMSSAHELLRECLSVFEGPSNVLTQVTAGL